MPLKEVKDTTIEFEGWLGRVIVQAREEGFKFECGESYEWGECTLDDNQVAVLVAWLRGKLRGREQNGT